MKAKNTFLSIFQLGVRQKVMLILLSVLLTALTVSGWMALKQEKDNTLKEINQRGSDISRFVAKSLSFSVVGYDYHTIQLLLNEITLAEDIGYAKVISSKGNTMAESGTVSTEGKAKLVMFNQDIKLKNDIIGNLILGLSTETTIQRLEQQKYALFKREALIILMIAFGEFLALSYIIIRPVSLMSSSLNNSVDKDGRIVGEVPVISRDEFGQLADLFNNLSAQLNDANNRLQSKIQLADKKLINSNRKLRKQSEELKNISEDFKKMSVTDELTGLHNRRRFEELMKTEMELSRRHGDINSIMIIDIDHFKSVNDNYGHPCGDSVLKDVSQILKENLRKTDVLCRIGGEEFVALCKRADKNAAMEIAEKLRACINNEMLVFEEHTLKVTISIGVSTIDKDSTENDRDSLYKQADYAVYHSKDNGRNQVTHFHDLREFNSGNSYSQKYLEGASV